MSRRKIERYVEAHREYVCYVQQRADYPELQHSAQHLHDLTEAKALWLTLLRGLTGGELAVAREIERTQALPHTPTPKEDSDA